eukprot:10866255-Alexandrium_andersonii.AAC.1
MSASLVGSEMCIRDRHGAIRGVRSLLAQGTGRTRPPVPTPPGSPGTVSYTHLTLPTICSV